MEELKNLKRLARRELEMFDSKMANQDQFTDADWKKFECLVIPYEKFLRICQIEKEMEHEGWDQEEEPGMSTRRGRNKNNGEYMSRNGYSQGFQDGVNTMRNVSESENGGNSMHYPHYPSYPYTPREW